MIAAVKVVLPWSMCPIVPMFTCGLVRSNFALATGGSSWLLFLDSYELLKCRGFGRGDPLADHSPRTFLTISSAMPAGTSAYESNSIEYDA